MSLALLFHCLMLNMFQMLVHPYSGACDLFVELLHGLYCSGTSYVVFWLGWCGIRMLAEAYMKHYVLQPASGYHNTTHEITQQISRKLLRMDVLTSETC